MCNERESDNHTALAGALHILPVQRGEPKIEFTPGEAERFWGKADKNGPVPPNHPELGPCWLWTRCRDKKDGYGNFQYRGRRNYAHRISYRVTHGSIPPNMVVAHRCDVPNCVRPDHLFAATHTQNMQDKVRKGRGNFAQGENHYGCKIIDKQVQEIRELCASGTMSQKAIGKMYGISATQAGRYYLGQRRCHSMPPVARVKKYYEPKLTEKQVLEIIELAREGKIPQREIGEMYGIGQTHVSKLSRGMRWKSVSNKKAAPEEAAFE